MKMKTISEAIDERLSQIRNLKKMDAENKIEAVYRRFPELRKIDNALLDVRTSKILCAIEHDEAPLAALNKREDDITKQRSEFLAEHHIPAGFEDADVYCTKCNDTGYVKAGNGSLIVCKACMRDALEEVFSGSGLKDFATYTLKGFKFDYSKDRARQFEGLKNLMEGKSDKKLMILNGGVQTGKTYLAVVSCKYAIMQGLSACYIKADRLSRLSFDEVDDLKKPDLLIIDDFSAEITGYDRTAYVLHDILEARLASDRATVLVSTTAAEVLIGNSDERIAGKLKTAGTL